MCGNRIAQTENGQILSLPGGIHTIEFQNFRMSLPREKLSRFRAFVASLVPNPAHTECGWRKDIYLSFSEDSPIQVGLDTHEWHELQELLDQAQLEIELAELLSA